jgi:hemerythrin
LSPSKSLQDKPQIDAQYEAIFNIAMKIAQERQFRGSPERLKDPSDELAKLLEIHFGYEERQVAGTILSVAPHAHGSDA